MVNDELGIEEGLSGVSAGPIVAAALAAGVAAYLIRRSRRIEEEEQTPVGVAAKAWERAQDADFRRRAAVTSKDWVIERVMPEVKPILLELLRGLKELTDQTFKSAEKAIKDL